MDEMKKRDIDRELWNLNRNMCDNHGNFTFRGGKHKWLFAKQIMALALQEQVMKEKIILMSGQIKY